MQDVATNPECDRCDTMPTNVNTPSWSAAQRRFLEEYRERPTVALAARLAGVHRATVYRWLADPAFAAAVRDAEEAFYRESRAKVLAEEAARQQWRDEREMARYPMRCHYLALARAAKQR
ncbi:unnamed protein product [Gemmataceae bacterium]|nr:unnamed protein product [Gemmataceae bacterium]VTU02245.1 unnamed protein product [Gemmataceae bacterium]